MVFTPVPSPPTTVVSPAVVDPRPAAVDPRPALKRKGRSPPPSTIPVPTSSNLQPTLAESEGPPLRRHKSRSGTSSRYASSDSRGLYAFPPGTSSFSSSPVPSLHSAFDAEEQFQVRQLQLQLSTANNRLDTAKEAAAAFLREEALWIQRCQVYDQQVASLNAEVGRLRTRLIEAGLDLPSSPEDASDNE